MLLQTIGTLHVQMIRNLAEIRAFQRVTLRALVKVLAAQTNEPAEAIIDRMRKEVGELTKKIIDEMYEELAAIEKARQHADSPTDNDAPSPSS